MRRLPIRICALIAAYALALHAVLAGMTLTAHSSDGVQFAGSIICTNLPGGADPNQNPADDHGPCILHCLLVACGIDGAVAPSAGVVAKLAPAEIHIVPHAPVEGIGRAAPRSPQSPRAPPLA